MSLSGEIFSTSDRLIISQATGRSSLGTTVAIGGCADRGHLPVIEQKSADGIVAKCQRNGCDRVKA